MNQPEPHRSRLGELRRDPGLNRCGKARRYSFGFPASRFLVIIAPIPRPKSARVPGSGTSGTCGEGCIVGFTVGETIGVGGGMMIVGEGCAWDSPPPPRQRNAHSAAPDTTGMSHHIRGPGSRKAEGVTGSTQFSSQRIPGPYLTIRPSGRRTNSGCSGLSWAVPDCDCSDCPGCVWLGFSC